MGCAPEWRLNTAWCVHTPSQTGLHTSQGYPPEQALETKVVDQSSFNFSSQFRPSNTEFSPWATTGGSCISWVWYFTATWSSPNKGNDPPLYFFKWNYVGCNLRFLNNFLSSTSETMDTADPMPSSMLTGLPSNNNWTWNPDPPCPLD